MSWFVLTRYNYSDTTCEMLVVMTYIVSIFAYIMVITLWQQMSRYEFNFDEAGEFVASSTIMIRGIIKTKSKEEVNSQIKQSFDKYFGSGSVVSVQTPRSCGEVERLYRKVKKYRIVKTNYRE